MKNDLFVGENKQEYRIKSRYQRGISPYETEVIKGMEGWFYNAGECFKTLGNLLDIKKMIPPEVGVDRAEYDPV